MHRCQCACELCSTEHDMPSCSNHEVQREMPRPRAKAIPQRQLNVLRNELKFRKIEQKCHGNINFIIDNNIQCIIRRKNFKKNQMPAKWLSPRPLKLRKYIITPQLPSSLCIASGYMVSVAIKVHIFFCCLPLFQPPLFCKLFYAN